MKLILTILFTSRALIVRLQAMGSSILYSKAPISSVLPGVLTGTRQSLIRTRINRTNGFSVSAHLRELTAHTILSSTIRTHRRLVMQDAFILSSENISME